MFHSISSKLKGGIIIKSKTITCDIGEGKIASDLSHDRIVEDECWLGEEGKKRLDALGYDVLDRSYDNLVWVDPKNKNKGKISAISFTFS